MRDQKLQPLLESCPEINILRFRVEAVVNVLEPGRRGVNVARTCLFVSAIELNHVLVCCIKLGFKRLNLTTNAAGPTGSLDKLHQIIELAL